ncbi:MAG: M24 family metallopeptidase [Parvibaculaceae bacterium]
MDMFDKDEYRARVERAQALMAKHDVAALFFTSEANVRYFTGYTSHRWLQPTSPEFGIIPRQGDPILVLPTIEMDRAGSHPWLRTIREATAGKGFVDTLVEAFNDVGAGTGRVAAELGSILRLCMTHADFEAIKSRLPKAAFIDGSEIFWSLRMIKSPAEIGEMRKACDITASALSDLHEAARPGKSERELHAVMSAAVMQHGADRPGSMPLGSRTPGEFHQADSHLRLHTGRAVQDGDLVWLDAGSIVGGYWSDTFRMFSVGKARQAAKDAYATVHDCIEATIAATRPGAPTKGAMDAFRKVIDASPYQEFAQGRFRRSSLAHGIGLDLIEPPYMNQVDTSILQPGMVLTLEPFLYQPNIGFFMIEEQVLVTETGSEVLSHRAPAALPEV